MGQPTSPTCLDTLRKCDLAVTSLKEVNNLQKQIIEDQDRVIVTQKEQLDSSKAWYHDPWKTIGLGLFIGLGLGVYARH